MEDKLKMMNMTELSKLVAQEEYQVTKFYGTENKADYKDIKMVEYYGEGKRDFFHDNMTADGKPPQYIDYLKKFLKYVVPRFIKDKNRQPTMGELHAFVGRANNMYISKMAELSLEIALNEHLPMNIRVINSQATDRVFGVDYVLEVDGDKYIYLHVFSDTRFGWIKFNNKGTKKGRAINKNGKAVYWQRKSSKFHIPMAYTRDSNQILIDLLEGKTVLNSLAGNIPIFEKSAVDKVLRLIEMGECDTRDTEFDSFKKWAREKNVELNIIDTDLVLN